MEWFESELDQRRRENEEGKERERRVIEKAKNVDKAMTTS